MWNFMKANLLKSKIKKDEKIFNSYFETLEKLVQNEIENKRI